MGQRSQAAFYMKRRIIWRRHLKSNVGMMRNSARLFRLFMNKYKYIVHLSCLGRGFHTDLHLAQKNKGHALTSMYTSHDHPTLLYKSRLAFKCIYACSVHKSQDDFWAYPKREIILLGLAWAFYAEPTGPVTAWPKRTWKVFFPKISPLVVP